MLREIYSIHALFRYPARAVTASMPTEIYSMQAEANMAVQSIMLLQMKLWGMCFPGRTPQNMQVIRNTEQKYPQYRMRLILLTALIQDRICARPEYMTTGIIMPMQSALPYPYIRKKRSRFRIMQSLMHA